MMKVTQEPQNVCQLHFCDQLITVKHLPCYDNSPPSSVPVHREYTLDMLVNEVNLLSDSAHREVVTFVEPTEITHHDQDQLESLLRRYSEEYPHITRLYDIGSSVQQKTLWVLEISDNPGHHEPGQAKCIVLSIVQDKPLHCSQAY